MKKKLILGLLFMISLIIMSACKQTPTPNLSKGEGTKENPYMIDKYVDLYELDAKEAYYYELSSDIYNQEEVVINDSLGAFYGHLDGNGYTIYDVIIQNENDIAEVTDEILYAGLFSELMTNASITNLKIENITVDINYRGYGYVGTLVGLMDEESSISNIEVNGRLSVYMSDGIIGGVVGVGASIKSVTTDLYMGISSKAYGLTVGGIAGENRDDIQYAFAKGEIFVTDGIYANFDNNYHLVGGISGKALAKVTNSMNEANIIVFLDERLDLMNISVGGIVGSTTNQIKYAMSTGEITVSSNGMVYAGGLAGVLIENGTLSRSLALSTIIYDGVNLESIYIGAIVGYSLNAIRVNHAYYSQEFGFHQAVGNYEDTELSNIENHSKDDYESGNGLEYLEDQFIFEIGKLPLLLPDLTLGNTDN